MNYTEEEYKRSFYVLLFLLLQSYAGVLTFKDSFQKEFISVKHLDKTPNFKDLLIALNRESEPTLTFILKYLFKNKENIEDLIKDLSSDTFETIDTTTITGIANFILHHFKNCHSIDEELLK